MESQTSSELAHPKLKVSVVGKNLQAGLMARELASRSDLTVQWMQTDKDRLQHTQAESMWTLLPQLDSDMISPLRQLGISVSNLSFFLDAHRRVPARSLFRAEARLFRKFHPAVLRRCLAIGLWNDLSPSVLAPRTRHRPVFEPNVEWPDQWPLSFRDSRSELEPLIYPRNAVLDFIEGELKQRNVDILLGERSVLGVEAAKARRSDHRIVHNAPFAVTESRHVLWASAGSDLREETTSRWKKFRSHKRAPIAKWKSFGAMLDRSFVAGLPTFSLWLDPMHSEHFLETGVPTQGILKKVFAIPSVTRPEHTWLQIESLDLFAQSDLPLGAVPARDSHDSHRRLDDFLWTLCPYLRDLKPEFVELPVCDENLIFADPRPLWFEAGKGATVWIPGQLDSVQKSAQRFVNRLRLK